MKIIPGNNQPGTLRSRREVYFFYERKTGVFHFHLEAGVEGQFPLEEAASLMAMHCVVRGQSPTDYVVMVECAHEALAGLVEKAERLLQAGHSACSAVRLTRREEEVLSGVTRSLANKEIAESLHLSLRTVKFHVSSLLTKFSVRGRMELVFKAAHHSSAPLAPSQPFATREAGGYRPAAVSYHNANTARVGAIALGKRTL